MSLTASAEAPRDRRHCGHVTRSYSPHLAKALDTRTLARFEDDDRRAGLAEEISSAQAGETSADDDDRIASLRTNRDAANGGGSERKPARDVLKKRPAIHVSRRISRLFMKLAQ